MEAHIPRLRRLLRIEIDELAQIDTDLADLEATMPESSGTWSKRTRESVNVTLKLCRNKCTDVTGDLDAWCGEVDELIRE